jgi:hypothetical protein
MFRDNYTKYHFFFRQPKKQCSKERLKKQLFIWLHLIQDKNSKYCVVCVFLDKKCVKQNLSFSLSEAKVMKARFILLIAITENLDSRITIFVLG